MDFCLTLLGCVFLICSLAKWDTRAELFTHFMLQYAVASLTLTLLYPLLRADKTRCLIAAFLFLAFSIPVLQAFWPGQVHRGDRYEDITLLQFNVNYSNPNMEKLAGWINNYATIDRNVKSTVEKTQPDIVVLQETGADLIAKLESLKQQYPYHLLSPKDGGAFGSAIYSKLPIIASKRLHLPDNGWNEYSTLTLSTPTYHMHVQLTELHAVNPTGTRKARQRNHELEQIATILLQQNNMHKILVGDLNISPYSPWFRRLERQSGLSNAMRGVSLMPTWPSFMPFFMRIPIDQLLVSAPIEILSRTVEHDMDSDHLPVITRLRVYKAN